MKNFKSIIFGILMAAVSLISQNTYTKSNLVGVQNFTPVNYELYFGSSGKVFPVRSGFNCDQNKENQQKLVVGNYVTNIKVNPCASSFFRDVKVENSPALQPVSILLGTNNKVDDSVTKLLDNKEFQKTEQYKNLQKTVKLMTENTDENESIRLSNPKDLSKAFNIWKIKNGYTPNEVSGTKWEFKSSFEKAPYNDDPTEWLNKYLGGKVKVADPGNDKIAAYNSTNSININVYNEDSNNNVLLTLNWDEDHGKTSSPITLKLLETTPGWGTRQGFKDVNYPSTKAPYQ